MIPQQHPQQSYNLGSFSPRPMMNPQTAHESLVKWRIDTADPIRVFEALLLGWEYDSKEGKYKPSQNGLRFCNDKGVAYVRTVLNAAINKNNIMGNIDKEMVKQLMLMYSDTIIEHVGKKYQTYEIDKDLRSTFVDMLLNQVYLALTRPLNDKEREWAVTQSKESVNNIVRESNIFPYAPMMGGQSQQRPPITF